MYVFQLLNVKVYIIGELLNLVSVIRNLTAFSCYGT